MTLSKVKPKRPTTAHKKRSGNHHQRSKAYHQPYWPYIPLIAIVAFGALLNSVLPGQNSVLDYATEMSASNLLSGTNNQRIASGLGSLAINGQLNTAAQNKANDMAARGYWSHNTPDGKAPWTFMDAAGYNYELAGENLAFGFGTSGATIDGWMASPGHRANILNAGYAEVGFGVANVPDYPAIDEQGHAWGGGNQTIIVAMYGKQPGASVAAPAAASGGTKTSPTPAPAPAPTPEPAPATETSQQPATSDVVIPKDPATPVETGIKEPSQQKITRAQLITGGNASWSVAAATLIGFGALALFLLRHGLAWHKLLIKGERFILKHPALDITLVSLITLAFVLTRGTGIIK